MKRIKLFEEFIKEKTSVEIKAQKELSAIGPGKVECTSDLYKDRFSYEEHRDGMIIMVWMRLNYHAINNFTYEVKIFPESSVKNRTWLTGSVSTNMPNANSVLFWESNFSLKDTDTIAEYVNKAFDSIGNK